MTGAVLTALAAAACLLLAAVAVAAASHPPDRRWSSERWDDLDSTEDLEDRSG